MTSDFRVTTKSWTSPIGPASTRPAFTSLPVRSIWYGTLVVGMPLWFAVPPDNPFRAENTIDDFTTRTKLGLEDVKRRLLRRRDSPFRKVIVKWDTTPEALRAWREESVRPPPTSLDCRPTRVEAADTVGRAQECPSGCLHLSLVSMSVPVIT